MISETTGEFLIVMSARPELMGMFAGDEMRGYCFGSLYRASPSYMMIEPAVLRDPSRCHPPEGNEELPGYVPVGHANG